MRSRGAGAELIETPVIASDEEIDTAEPSRQAPIAAVALRQHALGSTASERKEADLQSSGGYEGQSASAEARRGFCKLGLEHCKVSSLSAMELRLAGPRLVHTVYLQEEALEIFCRRTKNCRRGRIARGRSVHIRRAERRCWKDCGHSRRRSTVPCWSRSRASLPGAARCSSILAGSRIWSAHTERPIGRQCLPSCRACRILNSETRAGVPAVLPTRFELDINFNTAEALLR
jgi:hypothetical protein